MDAPVAARTSFMFETTLASLTYARKIPAWRERGYAVGLIYLRLPNVEMSIGRVRRRVAQGGHGVPETVIRQRFVFMVPGREPFGKEAFAAASRGMQGMRIEGTSDIRELQVVGDWAYLRCQLQIVVTPPGGAPMKRTGHTLTILRRGPDGRWLLARDANLVA